MRKVLALAYALQDLIIQWAILLYYTDITMLCISLYYLFRLHVRSAKTFVHNLSKRQSVSSTDGVFLG